MCLVCLPWFGSSTISHAPPPTSLPYTTNIALYHPLLVCFAYSLARTHAHPLSRARSRSAGPPQTNNKVSLSLSLCARAISPPPSLLPSFPRTLFACDSEDLGVISGSTRIGLGPGLRSGFDPPDLDRPGRLPHQQGLCEARLGYRDGSPQLGAPGPGLERAGRHHG